jgi:hypothetical protein
VRAFRGIGAQLAAGPAPDDGRLPVDLTWPGICRQLITILCRPALQRISLQPEEALCVAVADRLRVLSLDGRLRAIWTHVGNENPVSSKLRVASLHGAKRRAMGVISGAGDFVFTWGSGSGWIELKLEGGDAYIARVGEKLALRKRAPSQLSQTQRQFQGWAVALGVPHRVCRSVAQVEATLTQWGVLER